MNKSYRSYQIGVWHLQLRGSERGGRRGGQDDCRERDPPHHRVCDIP